MVDKGKSEVKKSCIKPALALFLLAPAIGELLSGSSPPLEFFNPFAFLLLASLYGSGAILIRELKVRWCLDYRGLLVLGATYGIVEEGLMVKSFFDPNWMDLGILGSFGRWWGVNWVWTELLTIYHAVFSIAVPIMLVELVYARAKFERWISSRWFGLLSLVLAAVTVFGFFFLTQYRPPLPQYMLAALCVILFIIIAYKLKPMKKEHSVKKTGGPRRLFITSTAASFVFFVLFYGGPYVISSPIIVMLLGAAFILVALWYVNRFGWKLPESTLNRFSVVSGALAPMIFLSFLMEWRGIVGMAAVSLSAIALLVLLGFKIKRAS